MKHGDIVTTNMPNVDLISLVEKDIKGGSQNLKSSKERVTQDTVGNSQRKKYRWPVSM